MSPIRFWPWLLTFAALFALSTWITELDDIGSEQLVDAKEHAQRDAEERRVADSFSSRRSTAVSN